MNTSFVIQISLMDVGAKMLIRCDVRKRVIALAINGMFDKFGISDGYYPSMIEETRKDLDAIEVGNSKNFMK